MRLFKMNTGAIKTENGGWFRAGFKGCPDILGFAANGKFIACEVKTGSGKSSKMQTNFRKTAERFGVYYLECRSIDEFQQFFRKITTDCPQ